MQCMIIKLKLPVLLWNQLKKETKKEEEEEKDKGESPDLVLNFQNSDLRSKLKEQKSIN